METVKYTLLFAFALIDAIYDPFHAESNKVFSLLKGQDLISVTPQDEIPKRAFDTLEEANIFFNYCILKTGEVK